MPRFHDDVFDNGLQVITDDADVLYVCSQEPTSFEEATTTYAMGSKASPTISAPQNGEVSGRRVVVAAITDGSVSDTGDVTHWALVDTSGERLLVAGLCAEDIPVESGNQFTLNEFSIGFADPE